MAYAGVEFADDNAVALICSSWLTPRKKHLYWPPYQSQDLYDKALRKNEHHVESWVQYSINRCFFFCDDLEKGKRKIKLAEVSSDIQSEAEEIPHKRIRKPTRRLCDSDEDEEVVLFSTKNIREKLDSQKLPRPPAIEGNSDCCNSKQLPAVVVPARIDQPYSSTPTSSRSSSTLTVISGQSASASSTPGQNVLHLNSQAERICEAVNVTERKDNEIIKLLLEIKEQNKLLLAHLDKKNNTYPASLPDNFPDLPCNSQNDLDILDNYLEDKENLKCLMQYLSQVGGKEVVPKVNAILRKCLSNQLASKYSFLGSRLEKKAFANLHLKEAVVGAVKLGTSVDNELRIVNAIKEWLKHAPQRVKLEEAKQKL
ncbi:uncharacterized protein LOC116178993 [Photinus pyralis]|uniref:DUF4806 domain-containing protein n=1 Tax=Photinus pyralis TaxID=7054 RepID=A0A1Y1MYE3_PHOPY|nr:uncharacterized protein LOC116161287 [Photinus pyralis]XP_031343357.1 uncharacterized protein LOC116170932 [Photinus pyralis]XP_031354542.1 uncharacterized protein LOC116178993 [Photinus pyralis]